jgi:hypothetical protein
MPGPKIIAGVASGNLARYNCEERIFSGTVGSSPGGGASSEVQYWPSETLADLPKVGTEDVERHVLAIARGREPAGRTALEMLLKIDRVIQNRRVLQEDEKWLDDRIARRLWDPQGEAPKALPTRAPLRADTCCEHSLPAQETRETADTSSPASANAMRLPLGKRRGRPPMYDHDAIRAIGEEVTKWTDPPRTVSALAQEVSEICTNRKIPVPKTDPGNRYLRKLLTGIFNNFESAIQE